MAKTNSRYTYIGFAEDAIRLATGKELSVSAETFIDKANALLATQNAKAEYSKKQASKAKPKGASQATKENASAIEAVLSETPQTASELNAAMGLELTPLQVANAVKFIEGAESCKVVRETINGKGLKSEKHYTAYFRA